MRKNKELERFGGAPFLFFLFLPAELQPRIAANLPAGEGDTERGGQAAAMGEAFAQHGGASDAEGIGVAGIAPVDAQAEMLALHEIGRGERGRDRDMSNFMDS